MSIRTAQAQSGPSPFASFGVEFGVTPRALRFYEDKGLLSPEPRRP